MSVCCRAPSETRGKTHMYTIFAIQFQQSTFPHICTHSCIHTVCIKSAECRVNLYSHASWTAVTAHNHTHTTFPHVLDSTLQHTDIIVCPSEHVYTAI